jgi:hypothetical protein
MVHKPHRSVATTATFATDSRPLHPNHHQSPSRPQSTFTTNTGNATSLYSRPAATGASWQLILIDVKKDFSNRGMEQRYCKLSIVIIAFLLAGLIAAVVVVWPRSVDMSLGNEGRISNRQPTPMDVTDTLPLTSISPVMYLNASLTLTLSNSNFMGADVQDVVVTLNSKRSAVNGARFALRHISVNKLDTIDIVVPFSIRFESATDQGKVDVMWLRDVCMSRDHTMEFDISVVGKWKPLIWPQKTLSMRSVAQMPCLKVNLVDPIFDGLVPTSITNATTTASG